MANNPLTLSVENIKSKIYALRGDFMVSQNAIPPKKYLHYAYARYGAKIKQEGQR